MRNQEAARYARWAAAAAGAIALIVAAVYAQRALREAHARRAAPAIVPATVQQQTGEFSFSKVEQDRTIFKVRASQATQFRDENRSVLKDVWITIYGRDGSRNDNIHTRECSYEPKTGAVQCEGEVQIDMEAATPASSKAEGPQLEVKTRNLSFNRDTGEATTSEPVEFHFAQGQGSAVGVTYSSRESVVRLERSVEFAIAPSERTGGLPVKASGNSLEIGRNSHLAVLGGPVVVRQRDRELTAERISVELDSNYRVRRVVAEGHPAIRSSERGATAISAERFEALLEASGWVERLAAEGSVTGTRRTEMETDHFSTSQVSIAMLPEKNLIRDLVASGGTTLDSHTGSDSRSLRTDALRVTFASSGQPTARRASGQAAERQRVDSFETLGPGTIETRSGAETTDLHAKQVVGQFDVDGRLQKLLGHSRAEVRHQAGQAAPQVSSANELAVTFAKSGDWDTLDESGDFRFQQADRQATAERARIVRSTDTITLEGSPVLSDVQSRTTAGSVAINQKSGAIEARGGVASTYLTALRGAELNLGSGPAHISADTLSGSTASGYVTYTGHARLWQGESVLDSDRIDIWRDEKKMQASGRVIAVFPQASAQPVKPAVTPASRSSSPTLWRIRAPMLIYWNDEGKAHMDGGVTAQSEQGSLEAPTLDVFLAAGPSQSEPRLAQGPTQLQHALGVGGVVVRQAGRLGKADQAEYTAADGKFVLSGGNPTLTDASGDTTTGRSLTFFIASDTILVDSQEGSRTLTKHRVEK